MSRLWQALRMLALVLVLVPVSPAVLLPAMPARAADPLTPWRYLQALQALRDDVAQGDATAWRAQMRLVRHMGEVFARLPDATWQKRRNAEALLVYLLAGGNPRVAQHLLRRKAKLALPADAWAGALAFALGRNGLALRHLRKLKLEDFSRVARAQLMLVLAGLQASSHPRRALELLDRVRMLRPGTLLEEAALRRALFLAGSEGQVERFTHLAGIYLRRFPRSYYIKDFLRRTAFLLVRLDYGPKKRPLNVLLPLLQRLPKRQQALLLAAVARGAIIHGKRDLTLLAGQKALALHIGTAAFRARLHTWMAAAQVVSPHPEQALRQLAAVDDKLLDAQDRLLRLAAMTVGRAIIQEPDVDAVSAEPGAARKAGASGGSEDLPIITEARAAAARVEAMLKARP